MQSFTGKKVTPLDLGPEQVCIEDIAHALSLICRFGGHCKFHYSVAQHSLLVARHLPEPIRIHGLLHDAAEAYLGDIIRPLKWEMGIGDGRGMIPFDVVEASALRSIYGAIGVPWPGKDIWAEVKAADNRAVMTEGRDIMGHPPEDWGLDAQPWEDDVIKPLAPEFVERVYLGTYFHLKGERNVVA